MTPDFEVARTVITSADRLPDWVARFAVRHGDLVCRVEPEAVVLSATDGATARLLNRWGPLATDSPLPAVIEHLNRPRVIALLLVRKGADAVGVAEGDHLLAHRVSRHYVQSRTKAGGWSQQRYARRRENQARSAYQHASDDAFEVLVPHLGEVTCLVTGGDRTGLREVLADPRLAGLAALPQRHPVLAVPDARLTVLQEAVTTARSIQIELDATAITIAPAAEQ